MRPRFTSGRELFLWRWLRLTMANRYVISPFAIITMLAALLLPLLLDPFGFFILFLDNILVFVLLTLGLQLILGYAGILNLGHAAFFGLGAYTSAILTKTLGVPFPLAFLASTLMGLLGGLLMCPIIRLRDVYFAMASFAFGIVAYVVFSEWREITNGHIGIRAIPPARIAGIDFADSLNFYYLVLPCVIVLYIVFRLLLISPFGTSLNAIRQSELAARSVGMHLAAIKVKTILIGAAAAGAGGSLITHLQGFVSPELFNWPQSVTLVTMMVIGGIGSFPGAIIGTFAIQFMSEYLRFLVEYKMLIYGGILVFFMIFLPKGIAGVARALLVAVLERRTTR